MTTLTLTLAFRDKEGAANMLRAHEQAARSGDTNGQPASFDAMEDLLASLVEQEAAAVIPHCARLLHVRETQSGAL